LKKICVIGAGLGGMSAAALLASYGFEVDVYEKNSRPGGKAGEINNNGFRFDTGPSLLTMIFVISDLFKKCGKDINSYCNIRPLEILCRYFYSDGTTIDAFSDFEKFKNELVLKTCVKAEELDRYFRYCGKIYNLTSDIFLFGKVYDYRTYLKRSSLKALLNIKSLDPFRTMHDANSSFFRDKRIVQLFDRYATYNGSDPYRCPATLNIIPYVEHILGGYFVDGGMYELTRAFYKLCIDKKVKFYFNSEVEKININQNTLTSVQVSGNRIHYDIIISDIDCNTFYNNLLKGHKKIFNDKDLSSSALVFYLGLKISSERLNIHNILFSEDYRNEFDEIFHRKVYPSDPTVYIYISSKLSVTDAPPGHENWFVMINAPVINENLSDIEPVRTKIINKIKHMTGYDIKDKIIYESVMTPYDIELHSGSYKGAIYGLSSNSAKSAFLRHPNKSRHYSNLYFCGGSSHPGGGIPLVVLSGYNAADEIINSS
jgi:phytoene desaturase